MCYCPNVIVGTKFRGSMKKWAEDHNLTENVIRKKLEEGEVKIIPCGQCLECRLNYAKNWAARCEVESYYYKENHFITLTYKDEDLPVINKITGECYRGLKNPIDYYNYNKHYEVANLLKKDVQDFLKRLRKWANKNGYIEDKEYGIRYLYCGEYGENKGRPHYHMLVYGLHIPDLKFHYKKKGYMHFISEQIEKLWGHGLVDIGGVDYKSCQYVARYIVKKQKDDGGKFWYKGKGLAKEFINMSLKPAIGLRYYQDHRDEIYSVDTIYLKEGRRQKPCKLYDIKEDMYQYEKEMGIDEETMLALQREKREIQEYNRKQTVDAEKICVPKMESTKMRELKRERRKKAMDALFAKLAKTTVGILDYFDIQAQKYEEKHKIATQRPCEPIGF